MGEQNEYSEIHLRVEKQTLRDIKDMCNLQRISGQAVLTGEAWVKVFKAIQKGEDTVDLILKEYSKEEGPMKKICKQCDSDNTYISENGYDTVMVCKDCHAEEHRIPPSRS